MRGKRLFGAIAAHLFSNARLTAQPGGGYRLEAFSRYDISNTTLDAGRRFVAAVFNIINDEPCMSERSNRNEGFPRRRLRPSYRLYGSRYDLAPIPCAFRALQSHLLGILA
jgi:hypothetical protein